MSQTDFSKCVNLFRGRAGQPVSRTQIFASRFFLWDQFAWAIFAWRTVYTCIRFLMSTCIRVISWKFWHPHAWKRKSWLYVPIRLRLLMITTCTRSCMTINMRLNIYQLHVEISIKWTVMVKNQCFVKETWFQGHLLAYQDSRSRAYTLTS